jgi:hypothetical protein
MARAPPVLNLLSGTEQKLDCQGSRQLWPAMLKADLKNVF